MYLKWFSTDYNNKRLPNLIPIIRLPFSENNTKSNQIHSNKQIILPDQGVQLKI